MTGMYNAIRRFGDVNPLLLGAWVMGIGAVALPFIGVPVRRAMGFRTNQYDKKPYKKSLIPNKAE
eukprot:CAMPEP_0184966910 /NCGR_PEP_ID=MMETSP1098-20130426/443_1 /TAXON_ID=89044 /ORGANISM="Spumella elongata, Strain CCAP 955/1" /LENGTH=64 /DNA_ID=CAMNT_0027488271 /DNA_START=39 /DNA_END=233 /DNA_ORIENTATION=-